MSSSQLNAEWYYWLRVNGNALLSRGYMWSWTYRQTQGAGLTDTLSFATADKPAVLSALAMNTTGDRGIHVDLFVGGSISLGTPLTGYPLNHHSPKPSPFASIEESGSIDAAGTLIGTKEIGSGLVSAAGGDLDSPLLVFAPDQFYYLAITNLHNQAADITVEIDVAAIGPDNLL